MADNLSADIAGGFSSRHMVILADPATGVPYVAGATGGGATEATLAAAAVANHADLLALIALTSPGIASTARLASAAASTNAARAKATPGRVYAVQGKNNAAYDVFLVLYDSAVNPPVPGTTTIRKKIPIPSGGTFAYDWPAGLVFATGIGYAFTKLAADADTTALVAADVTAFNLDYS